MYYQLDKMAELISICVLHQIMATMQAKVGGLLVLEAGCGGAKEAQTL